MFSERLLPEFTRPTIPSAISAHAATFVNLEHVYRMLQGLSHLIIRGTRFAVESGGGGNGPDSGIVQEISCHAKLCILAPSAKYDWGKPGSCKRS